MYKYLQSIPVHQQPWTSPEANTFKWRCAYEAGVCELWNNSISVYFHILSPIEEILKRSSNIISQISMSWSHRWPNPSREDFLKTCAILTIYSWPPNRGFKYLLLWLTLPAQQLWHRCSLKDSPSYKLVYIFCGTSSKSSGSNRGRSLPICTSKHTQINPSK